MFTTCFLRPSLSVYASALTISLSLFRLTLFSIEDEYSMFLFVSLNSFSLELTLSFPVVRNGSISRFSSKGSGAPGLCVNLSGFISFLDIIHSPLL